MAGVLGLGEQHPRRTVRDRVPFSRSRDLGAWPIPQRALQNLVDDLLTQQNPDSARDIGYLFRLLNQKGDQNRHGRYAGTRYVNGGLFENPAEVSLDRSELLHLRAAAEFDWRDVDPTIFGSLMEGVLGEERRERLGAHYTHESDIMKIVTPTIIRPWRERIEATSTATDARGLLDELCVFILLSRAHDACALAQSSTLETRLRYTPTTVFETFPWPDSVTAAARERLAAAASALYARRSELCLEHNLGLTKLYNLMEDGAFTDLASLHKSLDVAVAAAYGWPADVAQDAAELVRRLTELNRETIEDARPYDPFGGARLLA